MLSLIILTMLNWSTKHISTESFLISVCLCAKLLVLQILIEDSITKKNYVVHLKYCYRLDITYCKKIWIIAVSYSVYRKTFRGLQVLIKVNFENFHTFHYCRCNTLLYLDLFSYISNINKVYNNHICSSLMSGSK